MKKLMFVAAVAAAMTGVCDVTSANICGYMQNNLVDGFRLMAPAFVTIGEESDGFWLTDVIPSGADKMTGTENTIELETLDENGIASHDYIYHKGDNPRSYPQGDGWYESATFIAKGVNDVWFNAGEGFWVYGNPDLKFTTAGEVKMASLTVTLVDGFRIVANPFPTSIYLSKIEPAGAEKMTGTENTIELETLDENGIASHDYIYHKGDNPRSYPQGDGWYESATFIGPDNDVEIKAGEAVWVYGNPNLTLTFVSPFEDAE